MPTKKQFKGIMIVQETRKEKVLTKTLGKIFLISSTNNIGSLDVFISEIQVKTKRIYLI